MHRVVGGARAYLFSSVADFIINSFYAPSWIRAHHRASFIVSRCDNAVWMVDKYERLDTTYDDFESFSDNCCCNWNKTFCCGVVDGGIWFAVIVSAEYKRHMQVKARRKSAIKGGQSETKLLSRWTFTTFIRRQRASSQSSRVEQKDCFESQLFRPCYQQT